MKGKLNIDEISVLTDIKSVFKDICWTIKARRFWKTSQAFSVDYRSSLRVTGEGK